MRTPDQILREIREVEDQGVLLTFRKKKRIISDPRVLSGRMSVRDAAIGQIVEKEETVPEAQEQPSQPVQEMKDGGSLPDLPKYQVGTKTHPILGPIDFNDKSSGSFTKEDWDRMHKDERSRLEKFLGAKTYNELKDRPEFKGENVAEIFDGLGSSSWNDALQAHDQWHKSGRTYPTFYEGVEMFGALPMIGKAKIGFTLAKGAKGKLISAGKKIRTAADNVQKALNAADAGKDVYEEDLPSIESIQPTKPGTLSKEVKKILPKYQLRTNSFPQVTDKYGNKGTRVRLVGDIDQDTGKAYAAYAPIYSLPEATVTAKLDRTNPTAVRNWSRINDPVAYAAREATEDVANNYLYPIAEVAPGTGDVSDVMHLGKAVKDRDLTAIGVAATAAALPYVTYGAYKAGKKTAPKIKAFANALDEDIGKIVQEKYTGKKTIPNKMFVNKVNEKLKGQYGINRSGYPVRIEYDQSERLYGEELPVNVLIGNEKKRSGHMILINNQAPSRFTEFISSPEKWRSSMYERLKEAERPRGRAIVRESDFPFSNLLRNNDHETFEKVKGKGLSGEISKAISDVAKEYGTVFESSDSHMGRGLLRYIDTTMKGHTQVPLGTEDYQRNERFVNELKRVLSDPSESKALNEAIIKDDPDIMPFRLRKYGSNAVFRYKKLGGEV